MPAMIQPFRGSVFQERSISGLYQLIYSSQPFGFDEAMLAGILLDARRYNRRDGVTGALICRQDVYLQLLEGSRPQVESCFERIQGDDRHTDVRLRSARVPPSRLFGNWAMLHDPEKSWLWSREEINDGVLETADQDRFVEIFESLASKV